MGTLTGQRWRRMHHLIGTFAFFCLLGTPAWAQTPLEVSVDRKNISIGETVRLRIQVLTPGNLRGQANLEAPDLEGWSLRGKFEQTSFDGRSNKKETVINLQLAPERVGALTIGAFEISLEGKRHRSAPIVVNVSGAPGSPSSGTMAANSTTPSQGANPPPDERIFMRWEISQNQFFIGEPIETKLFIYYREGLRLSRFNLGKLDLSGFWNEETEPSKKTRATRVQVGEYVFNREEISRYTLFPLRAGRQALPQAEGQVNLGRRSLFNSRRGERAEIKAEPVALEILPLPTQGRPANYKGIVVGPTRLRARVDRKRIRGDEGIQLEVVTETEALLQNVPKIQLPDLPGFRVFPSSEKTSSRRRGVKLLNTRTQSWLLRPRKTGRLKLPGLKLPYFKTSSRKYATARTAPITIDVRGEVTTAGQDKSKTDPTAPQLVFKSIVKSPRLSSPGGQKVVPIWLVLIFFAAPVVFVGGLFSDHFRRMRHDSRGERAAKIAATEANIAFEALAKERDPTSVYNGIASVLFIYLAARFTHNFRGLTREELSKTLLEFNVGPQSIDALLGELEAADFARFAGSGDAKDLRTAIERARKVVAHIEGDVG